jgi:sugar phosphate permease
VSDLSPRRPWLTIISCRGTVGLLIVVYSSDHFKERSIHTVGGMSLGIIGLIVMATSTDTQVRYGFAHVCMAGVFIGGPLLAVWLAGNTPWKGTRSVMMGVNGWANVAGVIAGQLFKTKYRPRCKCGPRRLLVESLTDYSSLEQTRPL